ncbi:hypothetical protein ACFYZ8_31870 [Streptomyces sp. NPDC001668]|uniref:hypothetical protein n=1 Tax=unclassified Streptomyces TaxID=2593676 RepID=UPI0036798B3D
MSEWGSFIDEAPPGDEEPGSAVGEPGASVPGSAGADNFWRTDFVEEEQSAGGGTPPRPTGTPVPSSEAVASLLTAGETLWAEVDGSVAVLGSGCVLTAVYDDEPDGFTGWRPVTVVDPARLLVRPAPLSLAEPPVGVATSVAELYSDTEPLPDDEPLRVRRFPVGRGPDLDALLRRAETEERERVRAEAETQARRAAEELALIKRGLAERAELADRHARQREERAHEAVLRIRSEADQRISTVEAEAQREVAAAREAAEQMVRRWQSRAERAEEKHAGLAEQLKQVHRASVQRLVLVTVLAVIAVLLAVVLKGA